MQLLLQQQRVGAERDELLRATMPFTISPISLVDQRLAAGDRHHRRAALVDCSRHSFTDSRRLRIGSG